MSKNEIYKSLLDVIEGKEEFGLYIPYEILSDHRLNMNEKVLLSYYYCKTKIDNNGVCDVEDQVIMEELNFSFHLFLITFGHLEELGLIKTDEDCTYVLYIGYDKK